MRKEFCLLIGTVCTLMISLSWKKEEPQKVSFEKGDYRCEYEVADGMYNGSYTSWYRNGMKRAEGTFLHNIRHGVWTVYDSTGRRRMVRKYKNNFEFELIFPKPSDEGPIPLLREPMYKLEYSSKGFIPWWHLEERAVWSSKRIWRYVEARADDPLFVNNSFYHALLDSLAAGKLKGYNGQADDEFRTEITAEIKALLLDTARYELLGFNLKEDWFFDRDRMISETRIIGLMPVCRSKSNEADAVAQIWFYFPTIRPILAAQKVTGEVPEYIHTLDDVFFFRYFRSSVYKESNYYNRTLKENVEGTLGLSMITEQKQVEMSLIEMEHDAWIFFTQ